jgi:hypothetical protein
MSWNSLWFRLLITYFAMQEKKPSRKGKEWKMQSVDGYLERAQATLSCLGHLACFYDENAGAPPADFGFGLSVILNYIEADVREAYTVITKKERKAPQ